MPHIAGNTDYFERRPSWPFPKRGCDPLADRVFPRPHFFGQLVAHNDYARRASPVAIREIAALDKRNAERPEIIRRDVVDVHAQAEFKLVTLQYVRRRLLPWMENRDCARPFGWRDRECQTGGKDAPHCAQPIQ